MTVHPYRDLTLGLEVELENFTPRETFSMLDEEGTPYLRSNRRLPLGGLVWTFKGDASLARGTEFNSPVMTNKDLGGVSAFVNWAKDKGFRTANNCGLHIHVGCGGVCNNNWRSSFDHNWRAILPRLARDHKPHSRRNRYCSMDLRDLWSHYGAVRYNEYYGTIEFRFMNCRLSSRWIIRWMKIFRDLCALSSKGVQLCPMKYNTSIAKHLCDACDCFERSF